MVLVFAGLFLVDIGINSKFFIKKDFETAFKYLLTKDCNSFNNFLYEGGDESWCKHLHGIDGVDIKGFEILNLTHRFGSEKAFLTVESTILSNNKEAKFLMYLQMEKVNFRWKIIRGSNPK